MMMVRNPFQKLRAKGSARVLALARNTSGRHLPLVEYGGLQLGRSSKWEHASDKENCTNDPLAPGPTILCAAISRGQRSICSRNLDRSQRLGPEKTLLAPPPPPERPVRLTARWEKGSLARLLPYLLGTNAFVDENFNCRAQRKTVYGLVCAGPHAYVPSSDVLFPGTGGRG